MLRSFNKLKLVVFVKQIISLAIVFVFILVVGVLALYAFNMLTGGVKVGLIDIPTVVTFLLIDGLLTFFSWLLTRKADKPSLYIIEQSTDPTESNQGLFVGNTGGVGAESCQAKLTLKIKPEDVLDLRKKRALITTRNFRPIRRDQIYWCYQDMPEVEIRPDDLEFLELLRVIPVHGRTPFHFEIPSKKGTNPILVALNPNDYEGTVKVTPMNGKPVIKTFYISYDKVKHSAKVTLTFLLV